jgi:hypothetical protein
MKPFDDKFADNVRKTFDHWHEDMPPQAWDAMKARLDGKGRARVVAFWPFLAKTAGVALLLGMSIFWYVNFSPKGYEYLAESEASSQTVEPQQEVDAHDDSLAEPSPSAQNAFIAEKTPLATTSVTIAHKETEYQAVTPDVVERQEVLIAAAALPDAVAEIQVDEETEALPENDVPTLALRPQTTQTNGRAAVNDFPDPSLAVIPDQPNRFSWGITAGSMLAFAENRVSDGPGYAAGVTAEYAITDQISLSSGGVLTYHQFELINFARAEFASDYLSDHASLSGINLTGNNQYEMLALEIPLNAQFSIMETRKRGLYVGAGLSSLVYLQQRFTGINTAFFEQNVFNEATGSYEVQYSATTFEVDEQYPALSRFDFGRLVNLSLGYVIRRENSAIVVEPFVKLPLGTLTSRDISLGMGGISLKYRFSGY